MIKNSKTDWILENLLNKEKFPNLAWLAEIFQAS